VSLCSQTYWFGIRDTEKTYSESWIPDPGVKKAPDPGSGSATLLITFCNISISYLSHFCKQTKEVAISCNYWLILQTLLLAHLLKKGISYPLHLIARGSKNCMKRRSWFAIPLGELKLKKMLCSSDHLRSVLRIRMFIPAPGSEYFTSRIPDPNLLYPGSRGQKWHRIPDPQHSPKRLNSKFKKCGYLPWCAGQWDQWRLCCPRPAAQSRRHTSSWGCRTPRKPVSLEITTPTSNVVFARHRFWSSYLLIMK